MLILVKNATDQINRYPYLSSGAFSIPQNSSGAKFKDFYANALNFCNHQLQMAATHSARYFIYMGRSRAIHQCHPSRSMFLSQSHWQKCASIVYTKSLSHFLSLFCINMVKALISAQYHYTVMYLPSEA